MLNKNTSGTTGGKGEVPSQGTGPISPLFSRAQFLVCFGAGQQDSSGYSLAKEGWLRPLKKCREATLAGADGVVCSREIVLEFERTTPSAPFKGTGIFLDGASTPPLPRRGVCFAQAFSKIKCVSFTGRAPGVPWSGDAEPRKGRKILGRVFRPSGAGFNTDTKPLASAGATFFTPLRGKPHKDTPQE